jgi:hypothetical protein
MKFGVADYGFSVWDGGMFDLEDRLLGLRKIGYEGIERLEGADADEAMHSRQYLRKAGF